MNNLPAGSERGYSVMFIVVAWFRVILGPQAWDLTDPLGKVNDNFMPEFKSPPAGGIKIMVLQFEFCCTSIDFDSH